MEYRIIVIDNGQRFEEIDRVWETTPKGHERKIVKFKTMCPKCRGSLKARACSGRVESQDSQGRVYEGVYTD
jgi:hypothetical protein